MEPELKYSSDGRVCFDKSNHTYTLDGEKKLTSVTTLIGKFKNKFDSEYHAGRIAIRDGKTKEEILKQWKDKADRSCDMGTCTHFVVENYVLTGIIPTEFQYPKEKIAVKFINDFLITGRLIPVFVEYIVYNDHIAGQIDFVCRDEKGNWYILDFKTNEKISKDTYGKSLHGVLSFLGDASFYHYSLQLSIYKDLIKRFNINISKLYIVHIQENDYKFIPCVDVTQVISLDKIIEGSLIL
jgi:hypothetical protein